MKIITKQDRLKIINYTGLAIISGMLNFLFLLIVNNAIDFLLSSGTDLVGNHKLLLQFALVIIFFLISRWILNAKVISFSQKIYWGLRERILKLIVNAHSSLITKNKSKLYAVLANDINTILEASTIIITFISSAILVLACFVYLAFINIYVFLITLLASFLGIVVYLRVSKISNQKFEKVRDNETNFLKYFNYLLDLTKELQVFPKKGKEIFNTRLKTVIDYGEENNTSAYVSYLNSQLISQFLFYTLIVFVLFYSKVFFDIELSKLINIVFVLLYLFNPLVNLLVFLPTLSRASISLRKISAVETELQEQVPTTEPQVIDEKIVDDFEHLQIKNFSFEYPSKEFSVGPVDFSIRKNEILFIYGGNGSGKSTFIYLMLNILKSDQGEYALNNGASTKFGRKSIYSLFSPVFSDFKLFDSLYAIEKIDKDRITKLIKLFELEEKVTFEENQFSTMDLSLGQRKRLALIMAILEDRPILVLDEWAADQDPYFRKKFYTEIIHKIVKEENKTIVAITHDDKYYNEADRLFRMNYGKLKEITAEAIN
ncbi:MAG: cyclic peptide export ABC transporter [Bacteroidota bacterium]